jgi:hypothetical protein
LLEQTWSSIFLLPVPGNILYKANRAKNDQRQGQPGAHCPMMMNLTQAVDPLIS